MKNQMLLAENSFLNWISGAWDGFWQWVLGDKINEGEAVEIYFQNAPESWGVFVFAGAVIFASILVFWMYRREIQTCPPGKKILLASIRFIVLAFLVLLILKPSLSIVVENETKPVVPVIRDSSLSFGEKETYRDEKLVELMAKVTGWEKTVFTEGQKSRADILNHLMNKDQFALVENLRERATIKIYDLDEILEQIAVVPAYSSKNQTANNDDTENEDDDPDATPKSKIEPLIANGRGTDLRQGLKEVLNDSKRMAAIVLFSDGQHNGDDDVLEIAKVAAKKKIPIFCIGIGDPTRPMNVEISDLFVRETVRPDEPFEIEGIVNFDQLTEPMIAVDLYQHPVDPDSGTVSDEKSLIDSREITIDPETNRARVDFQHTLNVPGKYAYSLVVRSIEGEINTADNQRVSSVMEVVDEKVKVLLIAGAPTWEYRMVQRLLQRDQAITLSCWLQTMDTDRTQEGNEPISVLPQTIEELGQYNVVMLFDPDPRDFSEEWIETLKLFAKRKAGGVLYMAGPKFTGTFVTLNRLSGIREILPVQFGDTDSIEMNQALAYTINVRPGKMLLVDNNIKHQVMSFHTDKLDNRKRWEEMPSIYWSFPTLKAKPATQTLMERGDQVNEEGNQPLIVAGRYGAGNVLYFGFNGTWRWRRVGVQAQYFDRFWIQVVRFLVETRSLQGSRRGVVDPDRTEYELGDQMTFTARFLNEQFEPLQQMSVPGIISTDDGQTREIEFKMLPGQDGQYDVRTIANAVGTYTVMVNLPGADADAVEPVNFRVVAPSAEARANWLNEKILRDLADTSGGAYVSIDDLSTLVDRIPAKTTVTETKTPPQPLWDVNNLLRYFTFGFPIVLLAFEWAIRKWYRLL